MTTLPDLEPAGLEACPFCGGKAELHGHQAPEFWVACPAIGCKASTEGFGSKDRAIEVWNRRAARSTAPEGKAVAWRFRHSSSRRWQYSEERPDGPSIDLFEIEPLYTAALASVAPLPQDTHHGR